MKNHALVDGNERLGWLATATFLELNSVNITSAANDAVYELVVSVAAGNGTVEEIADRLQSLI